MRNILIEPTKFYLSICEFSTEDREATKQSLQELIADVAKGNVPEEDQIEVWKDLGVSLTKRTRGMYTSKKSNKEN